MMDDLISRQKAIDAFRDTTDLMPECYARDIIADLPSAQPEPCADTVSRTAAIKAQERIMSDHPLDGYEDGRLLINALKALPSVQPEVAKDTNVTNNDCISRKAVKYKLTALVNELEEIFSHIRKRNVDDSVCGLCEYDGAYIGESGDWYNECPGFDKDDCFKLKEKYREEWLKIDG